MCKALTSLLSTAIRKKWGERREGERNRGQGRKKRKERRKEGRKEGR
jgi:hypothetical protein